MNQAIENKFKAFLLHAFISAIFVFGLYIVTQQWYPSFYFDTLGILPIFLITLITNIFIFPLFTLIVYKKNKPKLLFDLTVIILLQITAFIYSVYTIHSERPLFLVYSIDRFVVVTANSINIKEVKNPEFLLNSPQVLAATMPKEKSLQSELLISVISGGPDIEYQPGLYEPLINQKKLLLSNGVGINQLKKIFSQFQITTTINNTNMDHLLAFPLVSTKGKDWLLLFNMNTMKISQAINTDPWSIIRSLKHSPNKE